MLGSLFNELELYSGSDVGVKEKLLSPENVPKDPSPPLAWKPSITRKKNCFVPNAQVKSPHLNKNKRIYHRECFYK